MHSPLGPLTIFEDGDAIVALQFGRTAGTSETPLLIEAKDQLDAYFDRARQDFGLPLAPRGSEFQRAVWDQMCAIPYGSAATYGDVARHLGIDPEEALRRCNAKFVRRFRFIEADLAKAGREPSDATLEEMEDLWLAAKAKEKA